MRYPNTHDAPENATRDGYVFCEACENEVPENNLTELQLELDACSDACAYKLLRRERAAAAKINRAYRALQIETTRRAA